MKSKQYSLLILACIGIFFLSCLGIWQYIVNVLNKPYSHGDLRSLAFYDMERSKTLQYQPAKRHIEITEWYKNPNIKVDILTIGDSCSNGGGGAYYQDYLTNKTGAMVVNARRLDWLGIDVLRTLYSLEKAGIIDKMSPKIIIIGKMERMVRDIYREQYKGQRLYNAVELKDLYIKQGNNKNKNQIIIPELVRLSYRYANSMKERYIYGNRHISDSTSKLMLARDFFNVDTTRNELVYYTEDETRALEKFDVNAFTKRLNEISDYYAEKGIKIVFLPTPDKMDAYYPYIHNCPNDVVESKSLDMIINDVNKRYTFIDTKKVFRKALEKNTMDLYWNDDTHWSWIGQQLAVDEMLREVKM